MTKTCKGSFKAGFKGGVGEDDLASDTAARLTEMVSDDASMGGALGTDMQDLIPADVLEDLKAGRSAEWGGSVTAKFGCKAGAKRGAEGSDAFAVAKGVECGMEFSKSVGKKVGLSDPEVAAYGKKEV